jgi:hypothetical protein
MKIVLEAEVMEQSGSRHTVSMYICLTMRWYG